MKIEIEAKIRLADRDAVRQRLADLNAERVGLMMEDNIFLDTPQRGLSTRDRGLRVRRVSWLEGDGEPRTEVTLKGPRQEGQFKSRREIEFLVSSAEDALAMLSELGYQEVMRFAKRRERWKLTETTIELDELPYLGAFIEIEGPSETAVLQTRKRLDLDQAPVIKSSYISMLTSYLKEHGITDRRITFDAHDARVAG